MSVAEEARKHFPALASGYLYAENAGGSQVLKTVADAIVDYLINTNVQLGAGYSASVTATERVAKGVEATRAFMNATSSDEIVFGSSTTMLAENLARAMKQFEPDDELVLSTAEHESNCGAWVHVAERHQLKIRWWNPTVTNPANPFSVSLTVDGLIPLLSSKTRLVAFTACSNILGELTDIKGIVKAVREHTKGGKGTKHRTERGAEVCVDCVAYAPHRPVDVQDWDVDYCIFSWYKVYGPHVSSMYTRLSTLPTLSSNMHFFDTSSLKAYKLQPGGAGYELTYGTTSVMPYLKSLGGGDLKTAWERIAAHEEVLVRKLMGWLQDKERWNQGVRIVGYEGVESKRRAPTISFVVVNEDGKTKKLKSQEIVEYFDAKGGMGIRWGHFYAQRLCSQIMVPAEVEDGVVRVSLVHYNTEAEVDRLIGVFEEILQ